LLYGLFTSEKLLLIVFFGKIYTIWIYFLINGGMKRFWSMQSFLRPNTVSSLPSILSHQINLSSVTNRYVSLVKSARVWYGILTCLKVYFIWIIF
jgi:hypothetical protein